MNYNNLQRKAEVRKEVSFLHRMAERKKQEPGYLFKCFEYIEKRLKKLIKYIKRKGKR